MSVGLQEFQVAEVPVSVFRPVGLAEKPTVERLQTRAASAVEDIFKLLDDVSFQVANCPTAADFQEYRKSVFPQYVELTAALGSIVRAKLNPSDLPGLIEASFSEMESRFASGSYFSVETRQEILFCVSTLRSAHRWLPHLLTNKPNAERLQEEMELARNYTSSATWSQFHLVALGLAQAKEQSILPEVLEELLVGLRASVMTYSYVRQALDLRGLLSERYSAEVAISWDEEDEALAKAL